MELPDIQRSPSNNTEQSGGVETEEYNMNNNHNDSQEEEDEDDDDDTSIPLEILGGQVDLTKLPRDSNRSQYWSKFNNLEMWESEDEKRINESKGKYSPNHSDNNNQKNSDSKVDLP